MLVLSRRPDESIHFPSLGISIQLLSLSPKRARIGIEAPMEYAVLRGEILNDATIAQQSRQAKRPWVAFRGHINAASELLQELHETIETCEWAEAESKVLELFRELKEMDQEVASLTDGAASPERSFKPSALVVDDSENERKLLASYLRLKNIDVNTVGDGGEAISFLSRNRVPDVVILDMKMPRFDGPWTVGELRSRPRYKALKIIAVSGMEPDDYNVEVGPKGVNRWLRKPLNPQRIIDEISNDLAALPTTA